MSKKPALNDLPGLDIYSGPSAAKPSSKSAAREAKSWQATTAAVVSSPVAAAPTPVIPVPVDADEVVRPSSKSSTPVERPIAAAQPVHAPPPPPSAEPQVHPTVRAAMGLNTGAQPYLPGFMRQSPQQSPQMPPPQLQQQQRNPHGHMGHHNRGGFAAFAPHHGQYMQNHGGPNFYPSQQQQQHRHSSQQQQQHHHHHGQAQRSQQAMMAMVVGHQMQQQHQQAFQNFPQLHGDPMAQYHPQLRDMYSVYDECYQQVLQEMRDQHGEDLDEFELDPDAYDERVFGDDDSLDSEEEAWMLEQMLMQQDAQNSTADNKTGKR